MVDLGEGGGMVVSLSGPFSGVGNFVNLVQITLPFVNWKGARSPYSMTVAVDGLSRRSRIDLFPSVSNLERLRIMGTGLCTENDDGTVTVYAIGNKPDEDITIQASITEVSE
ncbi:MAG: hypothetical protein MSS60_04975 [Clostridiales bacterium]|nr:hypothetical protein [Clostridiales bacterium]